MVNKYKKIVLVQGLEKMSDYQFRMVKSLLNKELKLTKKLQEEYDRISIADLMEDKFPNDAGLGKLINVCEDIPDIGNLPEILKKERTKVKNKNKQQLKAAKKRSKEEEPSISQPKSPTNKDVDPETAKNAPSLKKKGKKTIKAGMSTTMKLIKEKNQLLTPSASSTQQAESFPQTPHRPPPIAPSSSSVKRKRLTNTPKEPSREDDYQTGLKEVTVLKATEPFTYEMKEGKNMFHATVATENEFFKVKVFDVSLKEKFIPDNVIAISHYYGCDGFLEIYHDSCVYEIKSNSKMDIKPMLKRNASATPKIDYLYSQQRGIFVDGVFLVHKKQVRNECIYYTIGDKTGMMEVVVYGRLTNIDCEAGDKLRLFCFELDSTADSCQLRSVMHSHMKVINKGQPNNPDSAMKTSLESL
uniref:Interferon-activable protein 203 n=1 Tax=Jaculus jaculus TaxID=51337 RepID=A0A8C5KR62_JACJA